MTRWNPVGPNAISRPGAALVLLHALFVLWNAGTLFGISPPEGWGFAAGYAALFPATCLLVAAQKPRRAFLWGLSLYIVLPLWFALPIHARLLSFNRPGEYQYPLYAGLFILGAMAVSMWFAVGILRGEGGGWEALRGSPAGAVAAPGALAVIILPAAVGAWGWSLVAIAAAAVFLTAGSKLTDSIGALVRGLTVRRVVVLILCVSALIRIAAVLSLNRNIDDSKPWGRSAWGYHNVAKMLVIDPAAMLRPRKLEVLPNKISLKGEPAAPGNEMPFLFEAKPGYGLILGAVYWLAGPRASAGRWFNLVVSLLTLWFTFYLTRRIWNETAGVIALALHASSSYLLWQGIYIDESTPALLFFQLSVFFWIKLLEDGSPGLRVLFGVISGISFGLFSLIRPDNFYLFFAFLLLLFVRGGGKRAGSLACVFLAFTMLWGGWVLRNYTVYGSVLLNNNNFGRDTLATANPHLARLGAFEGEGLKNLIPTALKKPVEFTRAVLGSPLTWDRLYRFFDRRGMAFWDMSFLGLFDLSLYSFFFGLGLDVAMLVGIPVALSRNGWISTGYLLGIGYRVVTAAVLVFAQNYRIWVEPLMLAFSAIGIYALYHETVGGLIGRRENRMSRSVEEA